jgi:hypothetical protein
MVRFTVINRKSSIDLLNEYQSYYRDVTRYQYQKNALGELFSPGHFTNEKAIYLQQILG